GDVGELPPGHAPAQVLEDALGRLHPDVGGEETRLELLEDRAVDLAPLEQLGQIGGEPGVAAVQAPAQAPEQAGALLAGGFLGSSSEHRPGLVAAKPGGRPSAALARAGLQAL